MKPQEAISILEQATSLIQATRDEHQVIIQALQVINGVIQKDNSISNGVKTKKEKIISKI
tara:strand:+ start:291 stop:470 length:180 start_codon:yes stop_codon:yes gene_type:complete